MDQPGGHAGAAVILIQVRVVLGQIGEPQLAAGADMGDQGFDDSQLNAAGGGGTHPRHDGAGQHVQIYGQIEVVTLGDKAIQPA